MNEGRMQPVGSVCFEHGPLTEQDIIRVFPDGHECGYA